MAGPLFVELLLGLGVGLVGTALAARLGNASGAAFALAMQVTAMLFVLFRVVGAGISVVVAQALGAGDRPLADAVALASLGASSWIGAACALAAFAAAEPLLRLLNAPADVLPLAAPLLQVLAPAVLLDAWNATLASVLRSHFRARDTLTVNAGMQSLHLLLAWPLMAAWGLPGFAAALLLSRGVGGWLFWRLWQRQLGVRPAVADFWRLRPAVLAPVLQVGWPGAAENIAWRLAYMVSIAAVGQMGTLALATHAYTMQWMHVLLLSGLATGLAAEIVVGHLVGAGALGEAHRLVKQVLRVGLLVSAATSLLAALAGPWLLGVFTSDPEILRVGTRLLWLAVLVETGRTFNLVLVNTLRAVGDGRFPVLAGAPSFVLVMAGGSWWLGVHLGWGLAGVWLAYAADEWLRGLLAWWRWRSLRWVPAARRSHRRLRR